MNKIMVFGAFFFLMITSVAYSQETPLGDDRQHNQRTRIKTGVASGEVTRVEAKRLRAEQRSIRRTEHRAKADGEVTSRERARIEHKQNRASRDISRQKHDRQDRPRAN